MIIAALIDYLLNLILNSAKPGVTRAWAAFIYVISLGSHTIRDRPYEMGSMRPDLIILLLPMVLLAVLPFGIFVGFQLGPPLARKVLRPISKQAELIKDRSYDAEEVVALRRKMNNLTTLIKTINWILWSIMVVASILVLSVVSKAALVDRVFETNLRIIAPYIGEYGTTEMNAEFASVTTKAEFVVLLDKMQKVAKAHMVKLRNQTDSLR